ncbi:cytochrome c nitrite reductase small subunit [Planctomycetes bacterium K23_9]|uniref:Cytochrome c-type protein NrfH n=1 Tax=Stieleria marina TaxID=1930275 RepID=A0A517NRJ1_9BACT|nr:Cytochrome c-type protein NrfH [Planctomycetes bacterium K23_9]
MSQDKPETAESEEGNAAPQSNTDARPPRKLRIGKLPLLLALLLGVLAGLGTFTFGYGKGASYLSNNPETCVNCHVMQDHMDSWQQSSHHHVAVCNDCHLPHDFVGKWVTKADNGFFHSLAFTLQNYRDPIQIKPRNKRVTQSTCVSCHNDFVHSLLPATDDEGMQSCVHCHSDVGHAFR